MQKKELIAVLGDKLDFPWKQKNGGGNVWFEHKNAEGQVSKILFSVLNTSENGLAIIGTLSACKSFPEVENILQKYYKKYQVGMLPFTIRHQSARDESIMDHRIKVPGDIDALLPFLRHALLEEILPFLDRYTTIGQVYDTLERMQEHEMSTFIYLPVKQRRLILKRLMQDPGFEAYGNSLIDFYEKGPKDRQAMQHYQYLPELFEDLKNM